ncbi:MAG: DNA-directed RNA polymerase [Pseudomonadota bacterium]|nr:DNA-directed RNA polymerase [Pseudomonadota bacterium]
MCIEEQYRLESRMRNDAIQSYKYKELKAKSRGREMSLRPNQSLLSQALGSVSCLIAESLDEALKGRGGHNQIAFSKIRELSPVSVAEASLKSLLQRISFEEEYPKVCSQIGRSIEDAIKNNKAMEVNPLSHRDIERMIKSKTSDEKYIRKSLSRYYKSIDIEHNSWTPREAFKVGERILDIIRSATGYIEMVEQHKRPYLVKATQKVQEWLKEANYKCRLHHVDYLPMLCEPNDWKSLSDGGYLTLHTSMVKHRSGFNKNYFESNVSVEVFNCINNLQKVRWRINHSVYKVLSYTSNLPCGFEGLPVLGSFEKPAKPFIPEHLSGLNIGDMPEPYQGTMREWKDECKRYHEQKRKRSQKYIQFKRSMDIAQEYLDRDFWFVYQYDSRGRVYPLSKYLNYQSGGDVVRALLTFAEEKAVTTAEQLEQLKIHGANLYGLDKLTYEERVSWVEGNAKDISNVAKDPMECKWWVNADCPWQFLAFCFEYQKYLDNGLPFDSNLPISSDATCSGLQHLSAMLKDPVVGAKVNLIPSDVRRDLYQDIADQMNDELCNRSDCIALHWKGHVDRTLTKSPVMTVPYSVTHDGNVNQIKEALENHPNAKELDWLERLEHSRYLAGLCRDVLDDILGKVKEGQKYMREIVKVHNKNNVPVRWVSPVGFPVWMVNYKSKVERVKSTLKWAGFGFGDTKRVRTNLAIDDETTIKKVKQLNSICANVVQSMDAALMSRVVSNSIEAEVDSFMMIHDSFGTHVADKVKLDEIVRRSMVEIYEEKDILDELASYPKALDYKEITTGGDVRWTPRLPLRGDLSLGEVVKSRYFFS